MINLQKLTDTVSQHAGEINAQLKDTFTQENLKVWLKMLFFKYLRQIVNTLFTFKTNKIPF